MSDIQRAKTQIANTFATGRQVYVAFSGGKESAILAHLCKPYAGRFQLLWANTGFQFPHVEGYVRAIGEQLGIVELNTDLPRQWKEHGLPVGILPVANALGGGVHAEPKMQPWVSCCYTLRSAPMVKYIDSLSEPAILLHGQRVEDGAPGNGLSCATFDNGSAVVSPLADWTTQDVFAFIREEGIELPVHYRRVTDSLDCWCCPASFSMPHGADLSGYMRDEYPELWSLVAPGLNRILNTARSAVDALGEVIDTGLKEPSAMAAYVPQRGQGDCVIAATATAVGQSYELIAAALGFPCSPATGLPTLPASRGISIHELASPLLGLGFMTTVVIAREAPIAMAGGYNLPTSDNLKSILRRSSDPAVLLMHDGEQHHAVAWKGGQVIDCRADDPYHLKLTDFTVLGFAMLHEAKARVEPRSIAKRAA